MKNKSPLNLNMSTRKFHDDVHGHFAWMRQEAPIYQAKLTRWTDAYLITRYDDVVDALKDPRVIKNASNAKPESGAKFGRSGAVWTPKMLQILMNNMLNSDEPDHRRLRNLVQKAFTPRMITQLEPRIQQIAEQLLDNALAKKDFDLINEFAMPLPVNVIAEMIGIPQEDRAHFFKLTSNIIVAPTPLNMIKAIPSISRYLKYIRKLADKRRADPQDDLLTALVQAQDGDDRFSDEEVQAMAFLLLVAGHETTVNLIANGALALLENPEQMEMLRADQALTPNAVEEFLRYNGPLQTTENAFAKETFTLHDVTIPQGALILSVIMSANRDESVFEQADELDITRTPNKHLAFGHGIHYCLGAPLARLEGRIAFDSLLARAPDLRLNMDVNKIRYRPIPIVRRLEALPVSV